MVIYLRKIFYEDDDLQEAQNKLFKDCMKYNRILEYSLGS